MAELRKGMARSGGPLSAVRGSGDAEGNPPAVSRWLHRLAVLTAGMTLLLVMAGALVVGKGAGLAVPDWPLSFGTWMPPMVGGVFYEHGHRMVAAMVGLLTTILALWLWWKDDRRWVKALGLAAWLAVIVQAVLGGITVLYRLPVPVLIGHACLAQAFFGLTVSLALFTSAAWTRETERLEDRQRPAFRHLCAAATGALFLQLALGAALRHKALGVSPHLAGAAVASFLVGWVAFRAVTEWGRGEGLRSLSRLAGEVLAMQLLLGATAYFLQEAALRNATLDQTWVVLATTAHVTVGALLLGSSLLLTLLAYRRMGPQAVPSLSGSPQRSLA